MTATDVGGTAPPHATRAPWSRVPMPSNWFGLTPPEVLIGFDGTPSSRHALAWAAQEAALRSRPLRVLHAREDATTTGPLPEADGLLTEGILLAADALKLDRIRASAVGGDAVRNLAERAGSAELLVVGRGGETGSGIGPGASELLESTARATVVVPSRPSAAPRGRVVVGVRGIQEARDAMAVGFAEADRRGTELCVTVIQDDKNGNGDGLEPAFHAPDAGDLAAADELAAAVTEVGRGYPSVPVSSHLRSGHFADVLIEFSRSADLVVLGMGRRRVGLGRSDLLVATHADCPVIIVRETGMEGGH